ncbi:hypothetical protein CWO91_41030 [Bradyrhizobium genosp. SA-3]|nr:hypothetical protein CWO91_41030 [Bradyrhizobium genosp. SA-3]
MPYRSAFALFDLDASKQLRAARFELPAMAVRLINHRDSVSHYRTGGAFLPNPRRGPLLW